MKYLAVTSFNQDGYETYGRRMIESYLQNGLPDSELWVFSDEGLHHHFHEFENVKFFSLLETCPDQRAFEDRHLSPICHGRFGAFYDYRFDCVKFSHKPAAISTALKMATDIPDVMFWFDGDTVFKQPLTDEFIADVFPAWSQIGHFPRRENHTEAGILAFRTSNENVRAFIRISWEVYTSDQVYRLPAWTDCHVFDTLLAGAIKDGMVRAVNLGDELSFGTQHPIVNSVWARYVDHLKGARKNDGASYPSDVVVNVPNV